MRLSLVLTCALLVGAAVPLAARAQQCPDGSPPPCRAAQGARAPAPAPNSIAVLPFANRSPDTADVYLAEGMTEEVGNHLTQLSRLQVKAHGVVAAAWQRAPDPLDAARALRVAWYVHGSVRHVAPQLLVSVELVRPVTGVQVWAKRFARPDGDVFAVQAEVAESVAALVGVRLSLGERAVLARRPTRDNEAYRLYLLGNALLRRRAQSEVRGAVDAYTAAVRLDPGFASAWARIGLARVMQFNWAWVETIPKDSLGSLARAAAGRALALDSLSAEAWLAKGAVAQAVDNDLWLARAAFERSLTLDSLSPEAWHFYGFLYASDCRTCLADYGRAAPLFRRALALDPTLRNSWRLLGMAALHAGRLADAEALLDTALTLGPWTSALLQRAYVRFTRGNGEGALADLTAAERLDSVPRPDQRALYRVLLGDSAPARVVLARLRTQANSGQPNERDLARFSMALGMLDEVLAAMQHLRTHVNPDEPRCSPKATCSPSIATWLLLHEPIFASLHGDPRFERLWEDTRPRVPWQAGYH